MLGLAAPFLVAANPWQWLSPSPTGNRIKSFAHNGSQFVGVGVGGEIITSPDGATWTTRESGSRDNLNRVVYDDTRFVATGGSKLLTSTDGIAWSSQATPANFSGLAAGNHKLVAVSGSSLFVSADGTAWTTTTNANPFLSIQFANGIFVAMDNTGRALASTDGSTWTATTVVSAPGTLFFAAGNNRFLLSTGAVTYVSTDGVVWRDVTFHPADQPQSVVPRLEGGVAGSTLGFAGGYFYSQDSRYSSHPYAYYRSADGETWAPATLYPRADCSTLAGGGGVIVGTELETLYAGPNASNYALHSSPDGVTWTDRTSAPFKFNTSLVYGLGRFFAGGRVSSDAVTWVASPFEPTHAAGGLVFRVTSKFPFSDLPSTTINPQAVTSVAVSADGLTSLPVDVKMPTPRAVAYGAGRYVFVGDGGSVSSSSDALAWTAAPSGTNSNLRAVLFAFNRFVAVGSAGTLLTSPDGLVWTVQNTGTTADFLSLAADSTRVVVGTTGSATAVPDLALSGATIRVVTARRSDSLLWFDGEFTSLEYYFSSNQPGTVGVASSVDGGTWTDVGLRVGWGPGGTARIAAGNNTALMLLPAGLTWEYTPLFTAAFQRRIAGAAAPVITNAPAATTVHRGETANFSVGVTGSGQFAYQWNYNGAAIAGATGQILSLPLVQDANAGNYTVTVTNASGSVTSAAGTLTVDAALPLAITKQPVGGTLYEFQSFVLGVEVTGSGPITYQWRRNGVAINNATAASYEIWTASYSMDNYVGTYDVVVTAPSGSVTSAAAVVGRSGPVVTIAKSGSATVGGTVTLTATATGKSPFTYLWSKTGGTIGADVTSAALVLANLTPADAAPYAVQVTDADGIATKAFITVGVQPSGPAPTTAPSFAAQTSGRSVTTGQATTFSVSAGGSAVSGYQWQVSTNGGSTWSNVADGGPYSGATTATLAISGTTTAMNGYQYRNIATNAAGSSTSAAAGLAVGSELLLVRPVAIARDSAGALFVADSSANVIRKITPAGEVSVFAGTSGNAGSTDGAGSVARFNQPGGLAFDAAGNLYVADTGNALIRKISPTGAVTTLAGDASARGNVDATGSAARFSHPVGLAADAAGNLYAADTFTHTVRKITAAGAVTTLAGTGDASGSVDGTGAAARFNSPAGVAVDAAGTVYVADTGNSTIRKISPGGVVTTLAGLSGVGGANDGTGSNAFFNHPVSLAVDAGGGVYVADTGNALIRRVSSTGAVTLLAGVPGIAGLSDGVGLDALFDQPQGVVLDASGNLLVADTGNAAVRKIAATGAVSTLALTAAAAPSNPTPPVPTTPTTPSGGTSSPPSGGGGAPSQWFLGGLAILVALRRWTQH